MDYFTPFSQWVANILLDCDAPPDRVRALHVGIDLELWKPVPKPPRAVGQRLKILFVGGDFVRKGGPLLLDVFSRSFQDVAELHLVTMQAPKALPPHVHVYADFVPNDERLRALYSRVDLLVVPTTADFGPLWVAIEAMAMGLPVVGTLTGAMAEVIRNGETGFTLAVGDGEALRQSIQTFIDSPSLLEAMGARGLELVHQQYSAAVNVPRIIRQMTEAVRDRRHGD